MSRWRRGRRTLVRCPLRRTRRCRCGPGAWSRTPRWLFADGFVDEVGDEFGEGLPLVRDGGADGREFGGEACAAGGCVGLQAVVGAQLRDPAPVEERDRGVAALGCQGPEQGFHLLEVGRVVVEREGAVAPHRCEVVLVGQQTDGAGDFAAQDASHGLCRRAPCFPPPVDQCSLTVTGGTDNTVRRSRRAPGGAETRRSRRWSRRRPSSRGGRSRWPR